MFWIIKVLVQLEFSTELCCVRGVFETSIICFPNWTRVWRVWVTLILTEVLRNVVTSQLCHDVGDVPKRTQVLQPFMSSTFDALRPHKIHGLVSWILDSWSGNAQLLHHAMEQPLDVCF